ncbi:ABC transporter permease [Enterococcus sp. CWB-B31]|uniref:ABC transporter permease n=1 Tax=Enterococcus sp. CWB-B31 TaxID=2885159 RepID=UPI001E499FB6|nr:ABC transporter permease [Enterococcus sp. CWB-B31]MCB5955403.1 ABC transporter permease [Enterococcus sp. CWB-B31]
MSCLILIKKEAVDAFRTYRFFIMGIIFLLFGLLSPALAKLLPELIKSLGAGDTALVIELPTPTVADSWLQFFKNHSQMTLIIFVITFGNSLGKELTNGTLIFLVTKGISRNAAMLAKVIYQACLWFLGLAVSFMVNYVYNIVLFPGENQPMSKLLFYLFQLWLFGLLFILISNLGQVLLPKTLGGLLSGFLALILLFVMNISSELTKINPMRLMDVSAEGINAGIQFSQVQGALLVTLAICILVTTAALFRFKQIPIY